MENQRDNEQNQAENSDVQETRPQRDQNESGLPGGGVGRRDEVGESGVYPVSASEGAAPEAPIQPEPSWGQGERGSAGYEDSGDSELKPF